MTVKGPLVAGLSDCIRAAGIKVFGPSAAAAQLEGSKAFMKVRTCLFDVYFDTLQNLFNPAAYLRHTYA